MHTPAREADRPMTTITSRAARPRSSMWGKVARSVQCWPACHGDVSRAAGLPLTPGLPRRMTRGCSGPATWGAADNRPVGVDLGRGDVGVDRGPDPLAEAASKGLACALLHPALQIGGRRAGGEGQDADEAVPSPSCDRSGAVVGGQVELG